ncbi:endonuclease III [Candidatus Photodesmus katoptron]|uniref:Endonuclease III n=1 Tax=Candidatus Photodesmus katoptron Akat1 TaxID=1236703 RepID=S3E0D5_9GAMM|nr:endonuclease III [Candidatus Photodesmus katoptron]EPE37656.1 endonuclease III [Candidatus Photodesmus katoptron Akat1]KEY90624.1 endonuclease III [Candidatus Photodesmus katoptron]
MNNIKRTKILNRFQKNNPDPKTELNWNSPFELLIAVLLSAQTTDKSVNKVTSRLYSIANTPESLLNLGLDRLKQHIRTIGLFNSKAKHIIKTCDILFRKYNSQVPESREILESLPGVGRKTANVILNIIFGWTTIAVDTHIYRVCNRSKFAIGKTARIVEEKLLKVVPKIFQINVHHWLVLHGRYICKARNPLCNQCIIEDLCEFKEKTIIRN